MSKITINSTKAQIFAALEASQAEVVKLRSALKFEQDNNEAISEQWHEMNDANEELKYDAQVWRSKAEELQQQVYDLQDALTSSESQLQAAQQVQGIPQHFQESYAVLVDERNELIAENQRLTESCIAAYERCDALEAIVVTKSAPQPQRQVTAPNASPSPAVVESTPVVQITDADKAIWSKFQRLSREERMTIINWARPQFGHVGIHNIIQVRAAWHEFQAQSVA